MTAPIDAGALRIARRMARELAGDGAIAVVLTGSHARGDAHALSDIDLVAVFSRRPPSPPAPSRIVRGTLVTVATTTRAETLAAFHRPERATTYVPGWREAVILHDPAGVAAKLRHAAECWTWDAIDAECDRYVADSLTGLAEEAHKLAGLLAQRKHRAAAAQRSILAVFLAGIMAVHRRILFGTDNELWDRVADAMGPAWAAAQSSALGEHDEGLEASCRAALELYALAAADARALLDRTQRRVVDLTPGPFPERKGGSGR